MNWHLLTLAKCVPAFCLLRRATGHPHRRALTRVTMARRASSDSRGQRSINRARSGSSLRPLSSGVPGSVRRSAGIAGLGPASRGGLRPVPPISVSCTGLEGAVPHCETACACQAAMGPPCSGRIRHKRSLKRRSCGTGVRGGRGPGYVGPAEKRGVNGLHVRDWPILALFRRQRAHAR